MKPEAYQLMIELENTYWWYRVRREIIADVVRRSVPAGGELLDFGCGNGATAQRLAETGYRVRCCDESEIALAECRGRGLDTVREVDLGPNSFDAILACDVLEHVEDDAGLVARLLQALRPGGYFIVTVPAYEFLWSGEDHVSNHVRRYTPGLLLRLLTEAGLEAIWINHFNTLLSPVAMASIFWNRLFRPARMLESNIKPLPRPIDRLLGGVFSMERGLIPRVPLPFGISLAATARKSRSTDPSGDKPIS